MCAALCQDQASVGGGQAGSAAPTTGQPAEQPPTSPQPTVPPSLPAETLPGQAPSTPPVASQPPDSSDKLARSSPEGVRAHLAELFLLGATEAESPRPVRLLEALQRSGQRDRQEALVTTFWDTLAAGMYVGSLLRAAERLKTVSIPPQATALAEAYEAQLGWQIRRAALQLRTAQHKLAAMVGPQSGQGLPLPGDMFVVSEYRTYYQEVYSGKSLPLRVHQLGRTLPLRAAEVIAAAKALEAAEDWWTACSVSLAEGRGSVPHFFAAFESVVSREKELIDTVCLYNKEIAEYAFGVASPSVPPDTLASMLIGKRALAEEVAPANPTASFPGIRPLRRASSEVAPAAHLEAIPDADSPTAGWQKIPPSSGVLPAVTDSSAGGQSAPPATSSGAPGASETMSIQSGPVVPVEPQSAQPADQGQHQASAGSTQSETTSAGAKGSSPLPAPPEASPGTPVTEGQRSPYFVRRPVLPSAPEALCRFPALQALTGLAALRSVTPVLFQFDGTDLPLQAGDPPTVTTAEPVEIRRLTLEQCLLRAATSERLRTSRAYWRLAESWARLKSTAHHLNAVAEILTTLFEARDLPGVGEQYLHVRAVEQLLRFRELSLTNTLLNADQELKLLTDLPGTSEVLMPATVPHTGAYELDWDRLSARRREDPALRGLARRVNEYQQSLGATAEMLSKADRAAASALADFYAGKGDPAQALSGLELYFNAEQNVISHIVEYNLAIAEYADAVLPAGIAPEQFARALVPTRTAGQ
ncbi:MAG: hypothetical protein NZ899_09320 [Thermoguttaceae bacterium]|nr:hypothetical protein [Thermoguttaceae bacterium]MDW8079348.1 hypothetical protein [Thermoguttaceae bacterium]